MLYFYLLLQKPNKKLKSDEMTVFVLIILVNRSPRQKLGLGPGPTNRS